MNPQNPQNPYGQQPQYQQPVNPGYAPNTPGAGSGHNPYEFIINPSAPKRPSLFNIQGMGSRIAVLGGMFVILLIIGSVVMSALSPKSITVAFTSIDQQQEEIIRVASLAVDQADNQDVKNFLSNAQISVTASQIQISGYLSSHHKKISPKVLALGKSPETDTLLANAAAANNYNQVALQTVTTQLQTYATLLQTTYKAAPGTSSRQILQKNYAAAELLIAQAKAISVLN
jgi:hypothetical protein